MRIHHQIRGAGLVAALMTSGLSLSVASPSFAQDAKHPAATVLVQNDRTVPITVYLEAGEFDVRVGRVGAMKTATLPLPNSFVRRGDVQLFVHPDGELDLASQSFQVHSGMQLGLIVQRGAYPVMAAAPSDTMSAVLPAADMKEATITVENPRRDDVTVFLEQGDFDVRLGSVHAKSTKTLKLPAGWADSHSDVEIFVHPEHGEDLASETLALSPHSHLGLHVPAM
ncbi:MAG: hypothetical protein ABI910_14345 [Gemmatimonadota bacterium]